MGTKRSRRIAVLLLSLAACGDDLPSQGGSASSDTGTADTGLPEAGTTVATPDDDDTTGAGTTSEPGDTGSESGDTGPLPPPELNPEIMLTRMSSWPGGGLELTVAVEDEQGFPITADLGDDLELRWLDTQRSVPIATHAAAPDASSGHLLVMVTPGDTALEHTHVLAVVSELIERRPAGERIALYRWGDEVEQLVDFTHDRQRLTRVLQRLPMGTAEGSAITPTDALAEATHEVTRVGNSRDRGMRWVLMVGRDFPGEPVDAGLQTVDTAFAQWVFRELEPPAVDLMGAGRVIDWLSPGGLAAALVEAEARAEDFRDSVYEIGLCGVPPEGRAAQLTVAGHEGGLITNLIGGAPEDRSSSHEAGCEPETVRDGPRPFPEVIDFRFTPEQWEVYEQRLATNSKDDFELTVSLWDDAPAGEAVAHLRGQTSLGCARRNYTLDLATNTERHLLPGSATDEFYLLSMCLDDRYLRAHTVYQLYDQLGVFPLSFRLVELRLDGQSRGIYLLMEKAKEALVQDSARVRSVIRRGFSGGSTFADVKHSATTDQEAAEAYDALLAELYLPSGDALSVTLDERLDSSAYLRQLAMNTLLRNGDYVDENWLVSTDYLHADGTVGDWYSFMSWDPDDIFSNCHYGGAFAYADPYDIAYCAEAELDEIILRDPVTYGRFIDVVELVSEQVSEAVFDEAVDATAADLVYYLQQPGIAPAMTELLQSNPAATDPAVAQQDVLDTAESLKQDYAARRQLIADRVAAYRLLHP
ncbi:MAG: CotH kinase family protein [Myxococcota bacterium]